MGTFLEQVQVKNSSWSVCVANTFPGAILPAATGLFLKHLMAPLPLGHGPP